MISNLQLKLLFVVIYLVVDILYVSMSREYYGSYVKKIQGSDMKYSNANMVSAILSYIILGTGWFVFIANKIKPSTTYLEILPFTVLYGLIIYGVFNTTLFVMFDKWDIYVSIRDTMWGVSWITTISFIYLTVLKKI